MDIEKLEFSKIRYAGGCPTRVMHRPATSESGATLPDQEIQVPFVLFLSCTPHLPLPQSLTSTQHFGVC